MCLCQRHTQNGLPFTFQTVPHEVFSSMRSPHCVCLLRGGLQSLIAHAKKRQLKLPVHIMMHYAEPLEPCKQWRYLVCNKAWCQWQEERSPNTTGCIQHLSAVPSEVFFFFLPSVAAMNETSVLTRCSSHSLWLIQKNSQFGISRDGALARSVALGRTCWERRRRAETSAISHPWRMSVPYSWAPCTTHMRRA